MPVVDGVGEPFPHDGDGRQGHRARQVAHLVAQRSLKRGQIANRLFKRLARVERFLVQVVDAGADGGQRFVQRGFQRGDGRAQGRVFLPVYCERPGLQQCPGEQVPHVVVDFTGDAAPFVQHGAAHFQILAFLEVAGAGGQRQVFFLQIIPQGAQALLFGSARAASPCHERRQRRQKRQRPEGGGVQAGPAEQKRHQPQRRQPALMVDHGAVGPQRGEGAQGRPGAAGCKEDDARCRLVRRSAEELHQPGGRKGQKAGRHQGSRAFPCSPYRAQAVQRTRSTVWSMARSMGPL